MNRYMRKLIAVAGCCLAPCLLRGELAYDVRETVSGHPALVLKISERLTRVQISGSLVSRSYDEFVRVEDLDSRQITFIDHRHKRFASRYRQSEVGKQWAKPASELMSGVRVETLGKGLPAEWNGAQVKRDIMRLAIPNAPGPGEWRIEVDVAENPPGYDTVKERVAFANRRKDSEIQAMVNTLATEQVELLGDISRARTNRTAGVPVRTAAQFRLAAGAPILAEIGAQLAGHVLMSIEAEVENLTTTVDPRVFLVPAGYAEVAYDLLKQERARR